MCPAATWFSCPPCTTAVCRGILTFIFFIQTLRINRGLQVLFFSLSVLFFLLAGGVRNKLCDKVCAAASSFPFTAK